LQIRRLIRTLHLFTLLFLRNVSSHLIAAVLPESLNLVTMKETIIKLIKVIYGLLFIYRSSVCCRMKSL